MQYNYNEDTAEIAGAEKDCGLHDEYMEVFYEVFGFTPTQPASSSYWVIPKPSWKAVKRLWVKFTQEYKGITNVPDPEICDSLRNFLEGLKNDIGTIEANIYVRTSAPKL